MEEEAEEEEIYEQEEREEGEVIRYGEALPEPPEGKKVYLLSVEYDAQKGKAYMKLVDEDGNVYAYYDRTNHKPYLITDVPPDKIKEIPQIAKSKEFVDAIRVRKYNALTGEYLQLTKLMASDPLAIGGKPNSFREILPRVWEAKIRYTSCYTYDNGLLPGMPYMVYDGSMRPYPNDLTPDEELQLRKIFEGETEDYVAQAFKYFPLLISAAPDIKRAALDIEVYTPRENLVPNPEEAKFAVISTAFSGSDGRKVVYLLMRDEAELPRGESADLPSDVVVEEVDDEAELLRKTFKTMEEYPLLLTFNGDNFDLSYLYHRALNLGFKKEQIPISLSRDQAYITNGWHLDLYKFFKNAAIQIYAFGGAYKGFTLDEITKALLKKGKIVVPPALHGLTTGQLSAYNFNDAEITLELTTFQDSLVMKLIFLIMRISRLSIEEVVRLGISGWTRSAIFAAHREKNYLIPNQSDLAVKGTVQSKAIIKGKKYQGAIVIKPTTGVYFDVAVMDFGSLYPSIIKEYNLSYETIDCPHPQCRSNKIPGTDHWVCTIWQGIFSTYVGLIRDFRIKWFKKKAKEATDPQAKVWYDVVQRALKVFINASYGVLGAETFPLYTPSVAEATTAMGRYAITQTTKKAQDMGIRVLYGDTDSVFLYKPAEEQLEQLSQWAEKTLRIGLEVDKRYRYVVFSELKKNYLGVTPSGQVDVKGLLGKKRNTPEIVKKAFSQILQVLASVKDEKEFESAKQDIKKIVKDVYTRIKNKQFSLEEVSFNMMLNKNLSTYTKTTPQHVKAARMYVAVTGKPLGPGEVISFVKVRGGEGVKPTELASVDEIDLDKYIESLRSTLEQILDALGLSFDEIIGVTDLSSFIQFK
ncbi:MAG TPA: DNA-directed DNA polymerase I [Thermoprotei archaeon]|nr:DNA-directed DNA polymerase I [Thermoprotei archaeon]